MLAAGERSEPAENDTNSVAACEGGVRLCRPLTRALNLSFNLFPQARYARQGLYSLALRAPLRLCERASRAEPHR